MTEQNGTFTKIGEIIDKHFAQRQRATVPGTSPNRAARLLRWLTPNGGTIILILLLLFTQNIWATPLLKTANAPGPSANTINYQGRLADSGGNPQNGDFSMTFALYDAASGGNIAWGPETHAAVPVSDGLFSVGLGSQTSGGIPTTVWNGDVYLEVTVGGETLSPRELIRSVPIAGMALTVPDGAITQDNAPSLLKSGNGEGYEIYVGYAEISSTNDANEAYISFDHTFSEVLAVIPINNSVYSHYGYVIGVRTITGSGAWVRFSAPAGTYNYHVKYIIVGKE